MPRLIALFLLLCLSACGPQATPFPVNLSASMTSDAGSMGGNGGLEAAEVNGESEISEVAFVPIRYALADNTRNVPIDYATLGTALQIVQLDAPADAATVGSMYDIIVAYGDLPGGTRSPTMHHMMLVINPALIINEPAVLEVLRHIVNPAAITAVLNAPGTEPAAFPSITASAARLELANAGRPDGIDLLVGYSGMPGGLIASEQLRAAGFNVRLLLLEVDQLADALREGQLHVALIHWTQPEEHAAWVAQFGEANVIELFTLPISYLAVPEIQVTFNREGWPVVSR